MSKFDQLKPGDRVVRMLAGTIPMPLTVTSIENGVITCGAYTFNAENGGEIDEDLGWNPPHTPTGSILVLPPKDSDIFLGTENG